MTKREYDSLYGTTKDALGHKLYVGDLIVCCCYGNTAKLYIVKKICNIRILAVRADNKTWDNYFNPDRVIKINKKGIPKS